MPMKKRLLAVFPVFLLVLLCAACGAQSLSQEADVQGQPILITFTSADCSAGTVTAEHGEYSFFLDSDGYLSILYPDGSVYGEFAESGPVFTDYDEADQKAKGYLDGFFLSSAIWDAIDSRDVSKQVNIPVLLFSVLLAGLGIWSLCAPRTSWWLSDGWKFKNAEPSDAALAAIRVGGAILTFLGVIGSVAAFLL